MITVIIITYTDTAIYMYTTIRLNHTAAITASNFTTYITDAYITYAIALGSTTYATIQMNT